MLVWAAASENSGGRYCQKCIYPSWAFRCDDGARHHCRREADKMKPVLLSAIALILIGQVLLGVAPHTIGSVTAILFVSFLGFNVLEASQPSLVSKFAPGARKGAATGVYNTTQSIGLALGGIFGGWLLQRDGASAVFFACSGRVLCWLILAASMKTPTWRSLGSAQVAPLPRSDPSYIDGIHDRSRTTGLLTRKSFAAPFPRSGPGRPSAGLRFVLPFRSSATRRR